MNFITCLEEYSGTIIDISTKNIIPDKKLKAMEFECAKLLREQGVCELDRVALVLQSPVLFIVNFFAVIHIGAVPVLLSKMTTNYELDKYNKQFGIHWLITDTSKTYNINVDLYSWTVERLNDDSTSIVELKNMILQPTSGSSGLPKMCVRDEYGCFAEPYNHINTVSFANKSSILCPMALNHAYGFGTAFLLAFVTSSDLILCNELNPRTLLKIFNEFKISMFTGVPIVYELLSKMKIQNSLNMPDILLSAGAPLFQNISEKIYERFNKYIHTSYGSTETGEMCIERENIINSAGCVGKPLNNTSIVLEKDDNGLDRVTVKNPSMMVGYLTENAYIDRNSIREDGSFRTADLGRFDSQGRLYLLGRESNMINVFGVKVNALEIEMFIREFEEVDDVHVYAGKHMSGSSIVMAIVSVNKPISENEIINRCRAKLRPHKIPKKVFIVDKLPRNQAGKIIQSKLPKE